MKFIDNGSFYTVKVSRSEVEDFNANWPCSELKDRAYWFQFQKSNGDIVDHNVPDANDGPACLALSKDAQAFGLAHMATIAS
jgi:hypothetical protein